MTQTNQSSSHRVWRREVLVAVFFVGLFCAVAVGSMVWLTRAGHIAWVSPERSTELFVSASRDKRALFEALTRESERVWRYVYEITDTQILAHLAQRRHPDTRLFVEHATFGSEQDALSGGDVSSDLLRTQIGHLPVEFGTDHDRAYDFLHAKVYLRDDVRRIDSGNLTYQSLSRNREHGIVGNDPAIYAYLESLLSGDMADGSYPGDHERVIVCPQNCRARIESLLSSATVSIDISAQYVTDPRVIEILHNKKIHGVTVRLLVSRAQDVDALHESWLEDVTRVLMQPYLHTKSILIDDETLLVWSANFSTHGMDTGREVGIMTDRAETIREFGWVFGDDREESMSWEEFVGIVDDEERE